MQHICSASQGWHFAMAKSIFARTVEKNQYKLWFTGFPAMVQQLPTNA